MRLKRSGFGLLLLCILIFGLTSQSLGEEALLVGAAEEIVETISNSFGKQGLEEFLEFGGNKAVQEVLEKASREGGEELVERVVFYAKSYGTSALEVIDRSPLEFVNALDTLQPELVRPALQAAIREPEVLTRLVEEYGPEALEVAAKHPGVGTIIAEKLGEDGIQVEMNLSTDNAIRLAQYSDDIANLPGEQKMKVLEKIEKAPGRVLDYLEKHSNVLKTAAGVAIVTGLVISTKKDVLGAPGEIVKNPDGSLKVLPPRPGIIERLVSQITSTFHTPLELILDIIASFLIGWSLITLGHKWRVARYKQSIESARAEAEIARITRTDSESSRTEG